MRIGIDNNNQGGAVNASKASSVVEIIIDGVRDHHVCITWRLVSVSKNMAHG